MISREEISKITLGDLEDLVQEIRREKRKISETPRKRKARFIMSHIRNVFHGFEFKPKVSRIINIGSVESGDIKVEFNDNWFSAKDIITVYDEEYPDNTDQYLVVYEYARASPGSNWYKLRPSSNEYNLTSGMCFCKVEFYGELTH